MGQNKSLLKLGSLTLIEVILQKMKSFFAEVIIITNTPKDYEFLHIPLYTDIYPHLGPLSGIHSGLVNSRTDVNFFISCDSPCFTSELLNYVVAKYNGQQALSISEDDRVHYLFGIYTRDSIPVLERCLKNKELRVSQYFNKIGGELISIEKSGIFSDDLFFNVNTAEDYEKLKKLFKERE